MGAGVALLVALSTLAGAVAEAVAMVEDADVRNFRPTFVIGQHGVMRYADAPLLAGASGDNSVASLVVSSLAISASPPFERAD